MELNESQVAYELYIRLFQSLNKYPLNGLRLVTDDRWSTPVLLRTFDMVIYKSTDPLVIIEVKRTLQNKNQLAIGFDQVMSSLTITNARYGIVTDNEQFYLYDRKNRDRYYQVTTFDAIVTTIVEEFQSKPISVDVTGVFKIFGRACGDILPENIELNQLVNSNDLIQKIIYDPNRNTYHFLEEGLAAEDIENRLFIALIGKFSESKICRYTSLNSAFLMLNNLSFRMSGLVGMNDKSEVNYVDTYLDGIEKPLIKQDVASVEALNNKYITSCTTIDKFDDLTLWRLYADDGKGTCLVFDVANGALNSHVLLHRVKYADEKGIHKELDFLKFIKEEVDRSTGSVFEFRKLNFWKHFFKPHEYSVESEVRLLIIDNPKLSKVKTDWVLTNSHSIANPIIDFKLNSSAFPILLSKIVLGSKVPEQETNKVQLEELIRRKTNGVNNKRMKAKLSNIVVDLSKITHYR